MDDIVRVLIAWGLGAPAGILSAATDHVGAAIVMLAVPVVVVAIGKATRLLMGDR